MKRILAHSFEGNNCVELVVTEDHRFLVARNGMIDFSRDDLTVPEAKDWYDNAAFKDVNDSIDWLPRDFSVKTASALKAQPNSRTGHR
jgi:hypothetical protein